MKEHLHLRRKTWFVRLAVPQHLRAAVGRRELIRTTKTGDLATANRRKSAILTDLQHQLNAARINRELSPESADFVIAAAREAREAVTKGAPEGDAELGLDATIENHLERLREKHGEDPVTGDPNITDGHARAIQLAHKIFAGDEVAMLSTHSEKYLAEVSKEQRKQSVQAKRRSVEEFTKWLGRDIEVTAVNKKTASRYLTEELLKRGVSAQTTKGELSNLSAVWTWFVGRNFVEVNPWAGLGKSIVQSKRGKRSSRRPWTNDELLTLMKSFDKTDPMFALSALEIYTGARREEVCLFRKEDIEGNTLLVREGKTEAAVRTVPIHRVIKPLVMRLAKQTNDGFLIPGLLTGGADDKRGHYIGKRFSYHIRHVVGITDTALVGHSLRNSFINRCRLAGVPKETTKQIVGHEGGDDLTYGSEGYSGDIGLRELSKVVAKVSFGPLDAYLKSAASAVKVDANKSHRRSK
jgi:integrase